MVRTKEFDEEIVVDRAVRAFLKDSYSSTSVSALEAATGIGRKSIYNTFGSKQACSCARWKNSPTNRG